MIDTKHLETRLDLERTLWFKESIAQEGLFGQGEGKLEACPASDNQKVGYQQCYKTSNEETAATEAQSPVHGNFFWGKAEIFEEKKRFVESDNDDPGNEKGSENTEARHPGVGEFSRGFAAALSKPLHPATPFHHVDMYEGDHDDETQAPALPEPPCPPF